MQKIIPLVHSDTWWYSVADYAQNCSWSAGKNLAKEMRERKFLDWERVFVALDNETIAGYCTFAEKDCIPNVPYTPYIGYMFVGEAWTCPRMEDKKLSHMTTKYLNGDFVAKRRMPTLPIVIHFDIPK